MAISELWDTFLAYFYLLVCTHSKGEVERYDVGYFSAAKTLQAVFTLSKFDRIVVMLTATFA